MLNYELDVVPKLSTAGAAAEASGLVVPGALAAPVEQAASVPAFQADESDQVCLVESS